ncbi:hypothetical protein PENTCL1PPCAC_24101, partial [Pristionchus entomophagus]
YSEQTLFEFVQSFAHESNESQSHKDVHLTALIHFQTYFKRKYKSSRVDSKQILFRELSYSRDIYR